MTVSASPIRIPGHVADVMGRQALQQLATELHVSVQVYGTSTFHANTSYAPYIVTSGAVELARWLQQRSTLEEAKL